MFDVEFVRNLLGLPNPSAVQIPASRPEPESNPLIGDPSEYVLAKPRTRPVGLVEQEPREIDGQATAVGAGTGSSSPLCPVTGQFQPRRRQDRAGELRAARRAGRQASWIMPRRPGRCRLRRALVRAVARRSHPASLLGRDQCRAGAALGLDGTVSDLSPCRWGRRYRSFHEPIRRADGEPNGMTPTDRSPAFIGNHHDAMWSPDTDLFELSVLGAKRGSLRMGHRSCQGPMVRIRLPPAASLVRT